jgi:predicted NBD/HSP70 family sugar kinase
MEAIYKYAPISRSELATKLSLTPPTITTYVGNLIKQGLIYECENDTTSVKGLGRRPVNIDFIPNARYAIGIDINLWDAVFCIADIRGNVFFEKTFKLVSNIYEEVLEQIKHIVKECILLSGINTSILLGMGVSIPGVVHNGIFVASAKVNWENRNIANDISKLCKMPVWVENNAKARAISESMQSFTNKTFAYLLVGQGISCPMLLNGNLVCDNSIGNGEIGNCNFNHGGNNNNFLNYRETLNNLAGEKSIIEKCKAIMTHVPNSKLNKICSNVNNLTINHILEAQKQNDFLINQIVTNAISLMAQALTFVINFSSPQLILVDSKVFTMKENQEVFNYHVNSQLFGIKISDLTIIFLSPDKVRGARGASSLVVKYGFLGESYSGIN